MAAVFGKAQLMLVGKPRQLCGQLVAFAIRGVQGDREGASTGFGDLAFDASDIVDIGDDALTNVRTRAAGNDSVER